MNSVSTASLTVVLRENLPRLPGIGEGLQLVSNIQVVLIAICGISRRGTWSMREAGISEGTLMSRFC